MGLEILVGVAGATGAGKTSLLNALLEYPELLPSSSTEAATATVCRISYNHDDRKGREFRAVVKFRTEEAVVKELSEVLTAVKDRKGLRDQEFESEDARDEAIEELTGIISRGVTKMCAVWGLDESELEDMEHTVESVMANKEHIVELLGSTIKIDSDDTDNFATEVKPYLDSTSTTDGIIAWPLIEEVHIYVKSEILKHGIILVDLPGLSDTVCILFSALSFSSLLTDNAQVEDRSAVAESYYQNLSVTAIVTPAIRAVDEKTGVKPMGNYQELRMQLDGKYNKDSFCVVVSKIDDMDVDAFCKGSVEARKDARLQADIVSTTTTLNKSNETHRELKNAERKLEAMNRRCAALRKKIQRYVGNGE
jgi:GTP-binding protein EngB required for normal cell division